MENKVKKYLEKLPDFCLSHWLLRIPLIVVFLQQGFQKIPVTMEGAESFDLPYIVWWFAAYGEIGAGIGLLIGGIMMYSWWSWIGDLLTRFSGFVIGCIMTGVIWVGQPDSFMDVILYDNLHVLLWVGGLYFALRGHKT
tara:strand:+ start:1254 stop:1670 length:417 start_codon:yes stop_codon:yes gene_type:complete